MHCVCNWLQRHFAPLKYIKGIKPIWRNHFPAPLLHVEHQTIMPFYLSEVKQFSSHMCHRGDVGCHHTFQGGKEAWLLWHKCLGKQIHSQYTHQLTVVKIQCLPHQEGRPTPFACDRNSIWVWQNAFEVNYRHNALLSSDGFHTFEVLQRNEIHSKSLTHTMKNTHLEKHSSDSNINSMVIL